MNGDDAFVGGLIVLVVTGSGGERAGEVYDANEPESAKSGENTVRCVRFYPRPSSRRASPRRLYSPIPRALSSTERRMRASQPKVKMRDVVVMLWVPVGGERRPSHERRALRVMEALVMEEK